MSKYCSNPNDILWPVKKLYEKLETTSKTATAEFFHELSKGKKIPNEQIYHYEDNISLEKVTQSISSQTYFKYPGSYGLTEEFYKPFSNELSPVFLDTY